MPNFGRGAANAEKAQKENRPIFDRVDYFKIEDGEEAIIRPVHDGDEWFYVKQHGFVPTKDPDPSWDAEKTKNYPGRMGAVCRRDKAFDYGECYICDHLHERKPSDTKTGKYYPQIRYFVPVVLREAVLGTQEMIDNEEIPAEVTLPSGRVVSTIDRVVNYTDKMVEYQPTDKDGNAEGPVRTRPHVVIVNLGFDNFFSHLQGLWDIPNEDEEHTVLDRDFRVKRKGRDKDTKYTISALKPVKNPDGTIFDLRVPEVRAKYDYVDVPKIMTDMASDERYARFFDPRVERPDDGAKKGAAKKATAKSAPAAEQAKPEETETEDPAEVKESLAAIKARMSKSHGKAKAPAAVVEDEEEAAPAPSATESAEEDDESLVGSV